MLKASKTILCTINIRKHQKKSIMPCEFFIETHSLFHSQQ